MNPRWRKLGRAIAGHPKKIRPSCTCDVNRDGRRVCNRQPDGRAKMAPQQDGAQCANPKRKDVADWKKQPHENHTTLESSLNLAGIG